MDTEDDERRRDRNGSFAWVILAVSSICMGFVVSIGRIGGMVFSAVIQEFNVTRTEASFIFVIARVFCFSTAPIASKLLEIYTFRKVICSGGFLVSFGLISSAFCTKVWQMIITYGIILGIGTALLLSGSVLIVGLYFKKRNSFALGILFSSGAAGAMIITILFGELLDKYWFQGSLLIMGSLTMNVFAIGMLIRQPEGYSSMKSTGKTKSKKVQRKGSPETEMKELTNGKIPKHFEKNGDYVEVALLEETSNPSEPSDQDGLGSRKANEKNNSANTADEHNGSAEKSEEQDGLMTERPVNRVFSRQTSEKIKGTVSSLYDGFKKDLLIFKDVVFIVQLISRVSCTTALLNFLGYIPDYMKNEFSVPMNERDIAFVLAMSSIGEIVARFSVGSLLDKLCFPKKYVLSGVEILIALILLAFQQAQTSETLFATIIIYGLFTGFYVVVQVVLEVELMGRTRLPVAHGFTQFFIGIVSMVAGVLIGYTRDASGSYKIGIYTLGSLALFGGLIWFFEPILQKCNQSQKHGMEPSKESETINAETHSCSIVRLSSSMTNI